MLSGDSQFITVREIEAFCYNCGPDLESSPRDLLARAGSRETFVARRILLSYFAKLPSRRYRIFAWTAKQVDDRQRKTTARRESSPQHSDS